MGLEAPGAHSHRRPHPSWSVIVTVLPRLAAVTLCAPETAEVYAMLPWKTKASGAPLPATHTVTPKLDAEATNACHVEMAVPELIID